MALNYTDDTEFVGVDYRTVPLPMGEYEQCVFRQCVFASANLGDYCFADCQFDQCDLSLVQLGRTAFKNVQFKDCKLLGVHFDVCNTFLLELKFEGCMLNLSSFHKLKLKNTRFSKCALQEVDFAETNLTGATFDACDLSRAVFDRTTLDAVDFRLASNYIIDPEKNSLRKARFAQDGLIGLLQRYDIRVG